MPIVALWGVVAVVASVMPTARVAMQDTTAKQDSVDAYSKLIPNTAITSRGMFITHVVNEKLYFEIPRVALNKDMLMVGRFNRAAQGGAYGGERFASRTLRWERRGDKIILRSPSRQIFADSTLPISKSIYAATSSPIVAVFKIEAFGPDSAPVVEVTRLYTSEVAEFKAIRSGGVDPSKSFIDRASAFPENVEVEATQGSSQSSVVAHWSLVMLPEKPMIGRLFDERVGFITIGSQYDYGTKEQRATPREYIAKFRLEKKDPNAAVSDPVKPIVYYVDPGTPDEMKPWVKRGVMEWQKAFEDAGFSNGILAADVPADDPTWSMEDVRHTMVRWLPSEDLNAYAEVTGLQDPRSGETLNGSVFIYHNVMRLIRDWYFVQVGPLDPRSHALVFPEDLMGRLVQFVVAHEVGHALGLQHDMLGSSTYPVDSIRSKTWVAKMGHCPSVMDYSRFNYVAQPEDGIPVDDLVPRVGPYDRFAIRWGYIPIPNATNSDDERVELNRIAMEQDNAPWFRFANESGTPGEYTEAVGDGDAVTATKLGVKNLERVVKLIPTFAMPATGDNSELADLFTSYFGVVGQWQTEMNHVAAVIGQSSIQFKSGSQPGAVYAPLSRARQKAAVAYLVENALKPPRFIIDAPFMNRLETAGMLDRITNAMSGVLGSMLREDRLSRMIEWESRSTPTGDVYPVSELLTDVRKGVWSELASARVGVDAYRRGLQSGYIDQMGSKLNSRKSDIAALARGELTMLRDEIKLSIPRSADRMTRLHLENAVVKIDNLLEPKK